MATDKEKIEYLENAINNFDSVFYDGFSTFRKNTIIKELKAELKKLKILDKPKYIHNHIE